MRCRFTVAYYFDTKNGETFARQIQRKSDYIQEVERVGTEHLQGLKFSICRHSEAATTSLKLIRNYQNTYRFSIGGQLFVASKSSAPLRAGAVP